MAELYAKVTRPTQWWAGRQAAYLPRRPVAGAELPDVGKFGTPGGRPCYGGVWAGRDGPW